MYIVERQAQHRPDRLNKRRTDRLGLIGDAGYVNRYADRCVGKAGSVQKPGGHRKDILQGIYLGVSVGAHK